jgi:hypothetical protein
MTTVERTLMRGLIIAQAKRSIIQLIPLVWETELIAWSVVGLEYIAFPAYEWSTRRQCRQSSRGTLKQRLRCSPKSRAT